MYRVTPICYLYNRNSCFAFHNFEKIGVTFEFEVDTAKARQNTHIHELGRKDKRTQENLAMIKQLLIILPPSGFSIQIMKGERDSRIITKKK